MSQVTGGKEQIGVGEACSLYENKLAHDNTETGLPANWKETSLRGEIDLLTGYPFSSSKYSDSGVKLLRGSNIKRGVTDWSEGIVQYWTAITPDIRQYALKEQDIVIAMDGSLVGRSFAQLTKADLPALLLQRVARVRSESIDIGYLKEWICSVYFTAHCDSVKTVTAIPHISPEDIRSFIIKVPTDTEEQRAIAKALSDVDALLASLDKLIVKKRAIKTATMQQLLNGKKRLPGFSKGHGYNKTGLGDIPEDWNVYAINAVVENIIDFRGRTPKKLGMEWGGGEITALSAANVKQGFIDFDMEANVGSEKLYRKWMTNGDPKAGDIVFTTEAPLGNVALIPDDRQYILSQRTILLQIDNTIAQSRFIYYQLSSESFQRSLSDNATGSTAKGIKRKRFEKLFIAIPSEKEEQRAIARVLSDIDTEIEVLTCRHNKTLDIKQGMMQELLTGRRRLL